MGRVCAVKKCKSGSAADNKRRKNLNLKKLTLFKVPKSPTQRKQWIDSLSTELTENKYVCELHFHKNSIQHSYVTNLPNGDVNIIAKGRITRTPRSFPIIVDEVPSPIINNCEKHVLNQILQKPNSLEEVIGEQCNNDKMRIGSPEQRLYLLEQENEQTYNLPYGRKASYSHENVSANQQKYSRYEIDNNSEINLSNDVEIFNIIVELNKVFPIGWCFFPGHNQLTAIQLDRIKLKERIRLVIDDNQSVLVTFLEHYKKKIDLQIKSINDLINFLKSMEQKKLCTGTGFDTKRYSLKCCGDVTDNYKRWQVCPRCPECRNIRSKLQKLEKSLRISTNLEH